MKKTQSATVLYGAIPPTEHFHCVSFRAGAQIGGLPGVWDPHPGGAQDGRTWVWLLQVNTNIPVLLKLYLDRWGGRRNFAGDGAARKGKT